VFVFYAFTPSFILASPFVGNDGLLAFFGAFFFLCALRFNRRPSRRHFALLVLALAGALFSKLGGIVLLAAIPWILWRSSRRDVTWKPTAVRSGVLALVIFVWGVTGVARAWDSTSHQFTYYHGWILDYMEIKENLLVYVLRFDLSALIVSGQATTVNNTPDNVRFSFPSWEYGNMLLGEYEYSGSPKLLFNARQVIVSGTFLLFGLVLFGFTALLSRPWWPMGDLLSLNRTAAVLLIGAVAMLLSFVALVPNTCTADFRYLLVIAPWLGFAAARGLSIFRWGWAMRTLGCLSLAGYVVASVSLFSTLFSS
jgi:hypothetical protein